MWNDIQRRKKNVIFIKDQDALEEFMEYNPYPGAFDVEVGDLIYICEEAMF